MRIRLLVVLSDIEVGMLEGARHGVKRFDTVLAIGEG